MGKRILVVDDQPAFTELFREYLQDFGYTVLTANSAKEGRQLMSATPFDLVITDAVMPGESGISLLQELKSASPSNKVIMISGFTTAEQKAQADRAGVDAYIAKPLRLKELRDTVEAILRATAPPSAPPADGWQPLLSSDLTASRESLTAFWERVQTAGWDSHRCDWLADFLRESAAQLGGGECRLDSVLGGGSLWIRLRGLPPSVTAVSHGAWNYAFYLARKAFDSIQFPETGMACFEMRALHE